MCSERASAVRAQRKSIRKGEETNGKSRQQHQIFNSDMQTENHELIYFVHTRNNEKKRAQQQQKKIIVIKTMPLQWSHAVRILCVRRCAFFFYSFTSSYRGQTMSEQAYVCIVSKSQCLQFSSHWTTKFRTIKTNSKLERKKQKKTNSKQHMRWNIKKNNGIRICTLCAHKADFRELNLISAVFFRYIFLLSLFAPPATRKSLCSWSEKKHGKPMKSSDKYM